MRRWTFRLERVARIRQIERDRAHGEWVMARAGQQTIEHQLERMRQAARAEAAGLAVGQVRDATAVRAAAFRAGLRAQAAQLAVAQLATAAAATDQAATVLLEASRKVDVLAKLEQRQHEEWQSATAREETKTADDMSGTRAAARAVDGRGGEA